MMDVYETNSQKFTAAMSEGRWADAEAAARQNIDIIRDEEGVSVNFEFWVSRMNEAHLKRTLAAEIAAQDTAE